MPRVWLPRFAQCARLLTVGMALSASAATQLWIGTSSSPTWNTAANWQSGTVPAANDLLTFLTAGATGTALTNDIAAGRVFNGLTYQSGGDAFTVYGNGFGLNGGITNSGSAAQVLNTPVALQANGTISASSPVTLGGTVSGAFSLTKLGASTLTLSGVNSYTGPTVVNAGTLRATVAGALSSVTSVVFTAATAATLDLQGSSQTLGSLVFTNPATSTITFTGTSGSTLNLSPGSLVFAPLTPLISLTVNMSALSAFNYNNSTGTVSVVNGVSTASGAAGATAVTLPAGNNTVTAANLSVGNFSTSSGVVASTLNLGANNVFNVGTLTLGNGRSGGVVQFASGLTSPTLTLNGTTGGVSTTTLNYGGHDSYQASDHPTDLFDTTAGTLNAQFGTVNLGVASPTAGSGRGINVTASLKMGAGTLSAGTMTLGTINQKTTATNYTITITSLFSITNGGTANVTNLILANNNLTPVGTANALTNKATVSLTNGATLNTASIAVGNAASTAITTAQLSWGDGTLGNLPGGDLLVNGIAVVLAGAATTHNVNISPGQNGRINSWITGTGTLTAGGGGTLTLNGQNSFNGSLVMAGTNVLTLANVQTYSGNTLINSGTLALSGSGSLTSPLINVASNAVFDVSALGGAFTLGPTAAQTLVGGGTVNGSLTVNNGCQIAPGGVANAGTLTFNNDLALGSATVTFDLSPSLTSGNDQMIVNGNLTLNGNPTIWINLLTGALTPGAYTLMTYASLAANGYSFALVAPRGMTLEVGVNALTLVVTGSGGANLTWVGDNLANNWDISTTTNWLNAGSPDAFFQLDDVTFNDTGSANPAINLVGALLPNSVTVNAAQNYTFSGAGQWIGPMTLTKNGAGTLFLQTANTFSGGTVVGAGLLELDNAKGAGTGAISLGANTLNLNFGAGTLANAVAGTGTISVLETAGANTYLGGSLTNFSGVLALPASPGGTAKTAISSAAASVSSNATINLASGGTLYLTGAGVVDAATNNVSGPGNSENLGALRVDANAVISGPINLLGNTAIGTYSGSGTFGGVISDGGNGYTLTKVGTATSVLTGANTYGGGTTVSNGTLQVGSPLVNGTLPGDVTNYATLSFVVATNTSQAYNGVISGTGALVENGFGGTLYLNGINSFTGGVTITQGALWITNAGALGTGAKVITASNGTAGHPELHLNGINGNILLPATLSFTTSWAGGLGSQGVVINEAGDNEIDGTFNLASGGGGTGFVVNNGTLKLTGKLAPGTTSRTLVFGGVGHGTCAGVIADGTGANLLTGVTVTGPGAWTFSGANTYVTNTTVSGGTLFVNGAVGAGGVAVQTNAALGGSGTVGGTITVQPGGVIVGGNAAYTGTLTASTLTLGNSSTAVTASRFEVAAGGNLATTTLNVNGTNVVNIVDATLPVGTNTLFTYSGTIGGASGFAGFQLGTVPSGVAARLLNSAGAVQLAVTPLITVNTNAPVLTNSLSGRTLTLSWPVDHIGWRLLSQTNALSTGLSTNWFPWPGSAVTNVVALPLDPANPAVFFRLVYP